MISILDEDRFFDILTSITFVQSSTNPERTLYVKSMESIFQSLRTAGGTVSLIPSEFENPVLLKKEGYGFIVLPLKRNIHSITGKDARGILLPGEMLIVLGTLPATITVVTQHNFPVADELSGVEHDILNDASCDQNRFGRNSINCEQSNLCSGTTNSCLLEHVQTLNKTSVNNAAAVVVTVELCELVKGGMGAVLPDYVYCSSDENSRSYVLTITERLGELADSQGDLENTRVDRLTDLLLLEALDFFKQKYPLRSRILKGVGNRGIRKALMAIHENPEKNWSVEELASVANMSRSLFSEKFKFTINETPMNYVRQCRIQRSKILLVESNISIEQVAQECGYASQSSFIKSFTLLTGTSPGEWRTKVKAVSD